MGEDNIAQISGATMLGMKTEVTKQLQSNRTIAFQGMKGEPRFASLVSKMREIQTIHNSKVKSMQESIIESDRRNTDAQNTANQLLNQTQ